MKAKVCGIYQIRNKLTRIVYVGQSVDIERRKHNHMRHLKTNRHVNKHLQRSYNKYGESNFEFNVLEECSIERLTEREQHWLDIKRDKDGVYNYGTCADNAIRGTKGWASGLTKDNDDRVRKISLTLVGNKPWNYGLTDETDSRVKYASKKRPLDIVKKCTIAIMNSPKWRAAMDSRKGKKDSPEVVRNKTIAQQNKELRERKSKASRGEKNINFGKKASVETRLLQRIAKLGKPSAKKGRTLEEMCGKEGAEKARQNLRLSHIGIPSPNRGKKKYYIPFHGIAML